MTFRQLAELEPRLMELLIDVKQIRDDYTAPWFCANDIWHEEIKPRIRRLVGWGAESNHRSLSSASAYDMVVDTLYKQMPSCRACGCVYGNNSHVK